MQASDFVKGGTATGEMLVFVTTMGSPVLRYHAEKEIKKVVKEINEQEAFESVQEQREPHYFEDMYPHAIRHTFCSRCFEAGMQPKVVQSVGEQISGRSWEIWEGDGTGRK